LRLFMSCHLRVGWLRQKENLSMPGDLPVIDAVTVRNRLSAANSPNALSRSSAGERAGGRAHASAG
jgi:hypothetical protein